MVNDFRSMSAPHTGSGRVERLLDPLVFLFQPVGGRRSGKDMPNIRKWPQVMSRRHSRPFPRSAALVPCPFLSHPHLDSTVTRMTSPTSCTAMNVSGLEFM